MNILGGLKAKKPKHFALALYNDTTAK